MVEVIDRIYDSNNTGQHFPFFCSVSHLHPDNSISSFHLSSGSLPRWEVTSVLFIFNALRFTHSAEERAQPA